MNDRPSAGFTLADPAFWLRADRDEQFARLRRDLPLTWHDEPSTEWFPQGGRGFWSVVRHADVAMISKDQATFTSGEGSDMIDLPPDLLKLYGGLLNMHTEEHAQYRAIVNRVLTPRTVEAMSAGIDQKAVAAIERVADRGSCDFVEDIAGDFPAQIIGDLLSVPVGDRPHLIELTVESLATFGTAEGLVAYREILDYARGLVTEVRRTGAEDNFLGRLLAAEVDGVRMSEDDIAAFFGLLLTAGVETTATSIAAGFYGLSLFPDQRRLLQENFDETAQTAVEELIRWVSPVHHFRRTATRDVQLHGQTIKAGDKVLIWYGSANHDESVFVRPGDLDLRRNPNPHVSFGGGGAHFCLGAILARKEITIFLRRLFEILPDIEVAGPPTWVHSHIINAMSALPVTFTPRSVVR